MMIEALADGGVKMGLMRPFAYKLAVQTVLGAGTMVRDTKTHPGQLKDDVASPAGLKKLYLMSCNIFVLIIIMDIFIYKLFILI